MVAKAVDTSKRIRLLMKACEDVRNDVDEENRVASKDVFATHLVAVRTAVQDRVGDEDMEKVIQIAGPEVRSGCHAALGGCFACASDLLLPVFNSQVDLQQWLASSGQDPVLEACKAFADHAYVFGPFVEESTTSKMSSICLLSCIFQLMQDASALQAKPMLELKESLKFHKDVSDFSQRAATSDCGLVMAGVVSQNHEP